MDFRKMFTDIISQKVFVKLDNGDTRSHMDIIAESCIENDTEKLTESEQDLVIAEVLKNVKEYLGEESDEDKYLSAGQKKLPDGLKKGIIEKAKKEGKNSDEDDDKKKDKEEDEKDDKEKKNEKVAVPKEIKESEIGLNEDIEPGTLFLVDGSNSFNCSKYSGEIKKQISKALKLSPAVYVGMVEDVTDFYLVKNPNEFLRVKKSFEPMLLTSMFSFDILTTDSKPKNFESVVGIGDGFADFDNKNLIKITNSFIKNQFNVVLFTDSDIEKSYFEGKNVTVFVPKMDVDLIKKSFKKVKILESLNEESEEDKYLSAGQKKLPDGLKKGIIAKMKKEGKTADSKDEDKKDEDKKEDKKETVKESSDVLNFSQYIFGNVKCALGSNVEQAKLYAEENHESIHFVNEETKEQFLVRTFNGKTTVNKIEEIGNNKLNVKFFINESEAYQILSQGKYLHRNVMNPEIKSLIEFTQRSGRNVHWDFQGNCYRMSIKD